MSISTVNLRSTSWSFKIGNYNKNNQEKINFIKLTNSSLPLAPLTLYPPHPNNAPMLLKSENPSSARFRRILSVSSFTWRTWYEGAKSSPQSSMMPLIFGIIVVNEACIFSPETRDTSWPQISVRSFDSGWGLMITLFIEFA